MLEWLKLRSRALDQRLKQRRNYDVNERRAHHPKLKSEAKWEIQLFSVVRTFSLLYHQNPNVSWLSGFWRVSFEWKITYMFMACLDSALSFPRPVYVVFFVPTAYLHSLALVFCFKKCFYSAFFHSGKVILVSHHIFLASGIEWRKNC